MKIIKIFLASSIVEFREERRQLGDFIRSLNDTYVKRGIYFELTVCEDLSSALTMERKQQEYNDYIRGSQYFYVMFGRRAGEYTIEEFDVALEQFQASGEPRIFTYFLNLPEGEQPEQGVLDFMERLDRQIGHYYNTFVSIDAIKLDLLLELMRNPELNGQVTFADGQAMLDGQAVLPLSKIPLYSKNEEVQRLLKEQEELNGEFAGLAMEYTRRPGDAGVLGQMMQLGEKRTRVADTLHQLEMDMLGLCSQAAKKRQVGAHINWREKKAIACIDSGNYEGAKQILRDALWEREIEKAEERIEAAKEPVREYISGKQALIRTLMATGVTAETAGEIDENYRRCCELAEKHGVEWKALLAYAGFLRSQRRYPEGIAVVEKLKRHYGQDPEVTEEERAELALQSGALYHENRDYAAASEAYRTAEQIYRQMSIKDPAGCEAKYVNACNALAILLQDTGRMEEADELYRTCVKMCRKQAADGTPAARKRLAMVENNYGTLLEMLGRFQEAGEQYREALSIRRRYRAEDPEGEMWLARVCGNYANLLEKLNRYDEAEELHLEAVSIRRKLAESNPEAYEIPLALEYNNYAGLLRATRRLKEAERFHREALAIRRRFAAANPAAHEEKLAASCQSLANILRDENQLDEAERFYREAHEIRRRCYASAPDVYEGAFAESCENLARFFDGIYRMKESAGLHEEAIARYRHLADTVPEAYESRLAEACIGASRSYCLQNQVQKAEPLIREAREILRRLAEKHPGTVISSELAEACYESGLVAEHQKQMEQAAAYMREAYDLYSMLSESNPRVYTGKVADTANRLAAYISTEQPQEAERLFLSAIEIYSDSDQEGSGTGETELARVCHDLARFYKDQKRYEEAEPLYHRALEVYRALAKERPDAWNPYLSPACCNLADLKKRLGKEDEAEELYRETLATDRALADANPQIYRGYLADSCKSLAKILERRGKGDEACGLYREALTIYEELPGYEADAQRIREELKVILNASGVSLTELDKIWE